MPSRCQDHALDFLTSTIVRNTFLYNFSRPWYSDIETVNTVRQISLTLPRKSQALLPPGSHDSLGIPPITTYGLFAKILVQLPFQFFFVTRMTFKISCIKPTVHSSRSSTSLRLCSSISQLRFHSFLSKYLSPYQLFTMCQLLYLLCLLSLSSDSISSQVRL